MHENPGVTPMFLTCLASVGCNGTAGSSMYQCNQADNQRAHLIWFRPKDLAGLKAALKVYPQSIRVAMEDHFRLGGALSKDGPAALAENSAIRA